MSDRSEPALSVVLCTRNGASTIGEQLQALAPQLRELGGAVELVVVDHRSTDGTGHVLRSWQREIPAMRLVVGPEQRGFPHVRNAGARAARGRMLAFCDDDDVVGATWVAAMFEALDEFVLVTGPIELRRLNAPDRIRGLDVDELLHRPTGRIFLPFAIGANMGFQRRLYEQVGGFDETRRSGDDSAFSFVAQLAGHPLTFVDGALVHRRLRPDALSAFRQYVRYGSSQVRSFHDFRSLGMRRSSTTDALRHWAYLLAPQRLAQRPYGNVVRAEHLGFRVGRVIGSVRLRTYFP